MNIALSNSKIFALIVLVLLTALIVVSFMLFAIAHINVLHLFNSNTAVIPNHF